MCRLLVFAFLFMFLSAADALRAECVLDAEHLVKLERQILSAKTVAEMTDPLACILKMQEEADGFSRYLASSFLKVHQVLIGKEREEVASRIKNLYREIPAQEKLQRKFIDQIYLELFGPGPDQQKT